ncbi:hypothetical protein NDU88_000884 [Pleurodeles waltl]|uniref:Uncharacterized protein n=1 Tax=Pleurodeles waltl TaxID=8319 RepID=A0AAV7LB01_PLEWA|nr:hypothetical protein NDU88_000884 [Pleurodeles waltl]
MGVRHGRCGPGLWLSRGLVAPLGRVWLQLWGAPAVLSPHSWFTPALRPVPGVSAAVSAGHHIRGQRCRVVPPGELAERGAPGALIWFEQIGAGGKRIPPALSLYWGRTEQMLWRLAWCPPQTYMAPDIVNLLSGDLSTSGVVLAHVHSEWLRLVWDADPSRLDCAGPFSTLLLRLTPEAVWDWLELGDGGGTLRSQSRGVREQPAKMGNIQFALRRTTRRRRAAQGTKVIERLDGTLSLDKRRWEWEEARLFVQSVTAEVSPRSGSPKRMVD